MSQEVIFGILAVVTLVSAYRVVTSRLITHAALFLVLSFTSVAGVFLLLQQELIAALQVLIYVGAITTMILFAIMLSEIRDIKVENTGQQVRTVARTSGVIALVVAVVFALFMSNLYLNAGFGQPVGPAEASPARAMGEELFTTFVLPFEVASIILLLAMVGAIALTAKEDR